MDKINSQPNQPTEIQTALCSSLVYGLGMLIKCLHGYSILGTESELKVTGVSGVSQITSIAMCLASIMPWFYFISKTSSDYPLGRAPP